MSVDLAELIDPLKREVSPPGTDLYPNASDDAWLGSLTDAFWEVRLFGFLCGYEENAASRGGPSEFGEAIVTPTGVEADYDDPTGYSATQDLSRDLQQLIVLWAGWRTVLNQMQNLPSNFRAKAGPVEYETSHAATILKAVLDELKRKIDFVTKNLSKYGVGSGTAVFDALIERTYQEAIGQSWWVR